MVVVKEISTTQFNRDYVGKENINEPMLLTYYGEPICQLYPIDVKIKHKIENRNDKGVIERKVIYDAKKESIDVGNESSRTGQCNVCFEFRELQYGVTLGPNGTKRCWMCKDCTEKSQGQPVETGFGPKDMLGAGNGHTFYG